MAKRKTKTKEVKTEAAEETVVVIDKTANAPKRRRAAKKETEPVEAKKEGGRTYCYGHFAYHPDDWFGDDKRYCKEYLKSKGLLK